MSSWSINNKRKGKPTRKTLATLESIEFYNRSQRAADGTRQADRKAREQARKESLRNDPRLPRVWRGVVSVNELSPSREQSVLLGSGKAR